MFLLIIMSAKIGGLFSFEKDMLYLPLASAT